MKKAMVKSILVLKMNTSSPIEKSIEKPDHITIPVLRLMVLSAFLKKMVAPTAKQIPRQFVRQSVNPLDFARKIFHIASEMAETSKNIIPIAALYYGPSVDKENRCSIFLEIQDDANLHLLLGLAD